MQRLRAIHATLECSEFFCRHEAIGSSLLFVHDHQQASVWLIDFAKTDEIDHNTSWKVGNHEEGYLIGINNMLQIFTELKAEMSGDVGAMELSFASTTSSSMASTSPQHLVSESNNEDEGKRRKKKVQWQLQLLLLLTIRRRKLSASRTRNKFKN